MQGIDQTRFHAIRAAIYNGVLAERIRDHKRTLEEMRYIVSELQCLPNSTSKSPMGHLARDLTKIEKGLLNYALKSMLQKKREAWRTVQEELRLQRFFYVRCLADSPTALARYDSLMSPGRQEDYGGSASKKKRKSVTAAKFDAQDGVPHADFLMMKIRMCKVQSRKIEDEILALADEGYKFL